MGRTNKVVLYGLRGVGKTAILQQAIYGNLTKEKVLTPTIEDIYASVIETERGTKERVRFYDTGGPDESRPRLLPADGYLLVFDPSRPDSLDWIAHLKREIDRSREKKEVVVVAVSNSRGGESGSAGVSWASRERLRLFQVDALDRSTLYDLMVHLATRLSPQPTKSAFPQLRKRD